MMLLAYEEAATVALAAGGRGPGSRPGVSGPVGGGSGTPLLIDTHQIQDPAKRLDEINGLRTTLVGVLAGLAVIGGAVVGLLNFRETRRQNRALLESPAVPPRDGPPPRGRLRRRPGGVRRVR